MSGSWGLRPGIRKCLRSSLDQAKLELWKRVSDGEELGSRTIGVPRATEVPE